jgi:hypothetical protein
MGGKTGTYGGKGGGEACTDDDEDENVADDVLANDDADDPLGGDLNGARLRELSAMILH